MDKNIEAKFSIDEEGTLRVDFLFWLHDAPHRKNYKKITFFQKYKKDKIDPRKIEAFIRYLLLKKVITPELLFHQNISHVKLMIMKNLALIEKEPSKGGGLSRNKEVFREFMDRYEESGIGAFPSNAKPIITQLSGEPIPNIKNPDDVSIWPKDGLLSVDKENADTGKSTLILGASFSGKTYLLAHELNKIQPGDYECIILFTESVNADPLKDINPRLNVQVFQGFKPNIVDFLKRVNDLLENRFRILCILDDVVDQKMSKTLNKMILTYRNANISTCILIQYPNLISKSSRSSFHQVAITGSRSLEFWDSTCKVFDLRGWAKGQIENPHQKKRTLNDEIYMFLKNATKSPGEILYIDLRKGREPLLYQLK
jgi:hypothetical protein